MTRWNLRTSFRNLAAHIPTLLACTPLQLHAGNALHRAHPQ
ncbi:hypothetical protein M3J09_004869 [Ascochyta lentis]